MTKEIGEGRKGSGNRYRRREEFGLLEEQSAVPVCLRPASAPADRSVSVHLPRAARSSNPLSETGKDGAANDKTWCLRLNPVSLGLIVRGLAADPEALGG